MEQDLIAPIPHPTSEDLKDAFTLWQARRIVDLGDALFTPTFAKHHSCGREMGQDVATSGDVMVLSWDDMERSALSLSDALPFKSCRTRDIKNHQPS
jgi:hypothetical protein